MDTGETVQLHSTSAEQTESFGVSLGAKLRGGEVIELISDLGGGKTTMTRGIARGAGSPDKVSSPTFTISKTYETPTFDIVHFDFYRLDEAGIIAEELREVMHDPTYVVLVEWGDRVQTVLPDSRLTIDIALQADGSRLLTYTYPPELSYLVEGGSVA